MEICFKLEKGNEDIESLAPRHNMLSKKWRESFTWRQTHYDLLQVPATSARSDCHFRQNRPLLHGNKAATVVFSSAFKNGALWRRRWQYGSAVRKLMSGSKLGPACQRRILAEFRENPHKLHTWSEYSRHFLLCFGCWLGFCGFETVQYLHHLVDYQFDKPYASSIVIYKHIHFIFRDLTYIGLLVQCMFPVGPASCQRLEREQLREIVCHLPGSFDTRNSGTPVWSTLHMWQYYKLSIITQPQWKVQNCWQYSNL